MSVRDLVLAHLPRGEFTPLQVIRAVNASLPAPEQVGGDYIEAALRALAREGRRVVATSRNTFARRAHAERLGLHAYVPLQPKTTPEPPPRHLLVRRGSARRPAPVRTSAPVQCTAPPAAPAATPSEDDPLAPRTLHAQRVRLAEALRDVHDVVAARDVALQRLYRRPVEPELRAAEVALANALAVIEGALEVAAR